MEGYKDSIFLHIHSVNCLVDIQEHNEAVFSNLKTRIQASINVVMMFFAITLHKQYVPS